MMIPSWIFIAMRWEIFWSYNTPFRQLNCLYVSTNHSHGAVFSTTLLPAAATEWPWELLLQLLPETGASDWKQRHNQRAICSSSSSHPNTFLRSSDVSRDPRSSATSVWSAQKLELAHSSCNYSLKNNIRCTALTKRVCPWILLLAIFLYYIQTNSVLIGTAGHFSLKRNKSHHMHTQRNQHICGLDFIGCHIPLDAVQASRGNQMLSRKKTDSSLHCTRGYSSEWYSSFCWDFFLP